ncbi:unnamed protein product, partial [marine sediment metagenome]
ITPQGRVYEATNCESAYEWRQTARYLGLLLRCHSLILRSQTNDALNQLADSGFVDRPSYNPGRGTPFVTLRLTRAVPPFLYAAEVFDVVGPIDWLQGHTLGQAIGDGLRSALQSMLRVGSPSLIVIDPNRDWTAVLEPGSLIAALATQVIAVLRQPGTTIRCSGCDTTYKRTAGLRPGERNYCEACRTAKVPQRHAQRDSRRRKRLAAEVRDASS